MSGLSPGGHGKGGWSSDPRVFSGQVGKALDDLTGAVRSLERGVDKRFQRFQEQLDAIGTDVVVMRNSMVTKDGCAAGRAQLGNDLKDRMDGKREVTGVHYTVPEQWAQQIVAAHVEQDVEEEESEVERPEPKPLGYWIKLIIGIITLISIVGTGAVYAYRGYMALTAFEQAQRRQFVQQPEHGKQPR